MDSISRTDWPPLTPLPPSQLYQNCPTVVPGICHRSPSPMEPLSQTRSHQALNQSQEMPRPPGKEGTQLLGKEKNDLAAADSSCPSSTSPFILFICACMCVVLEIEPRAFRVLKQSLPESLKLPSRTRNFGPSSPPRVPGLQAGTIINLTSLNSFRRVSEELNAFWLV